MTAEVASSTIAQLLFLESQDPEKPIHFYINSPGGSVSDGLAIYDTMQFIKSPVHTVCMGMAASMGSLLLAAGAKGQRAALPNSRIMVHQPHGGARVLDTDYVSLIISFRDKLVILLLLLMRFFILARGSTTFTPITPESPSPKSVLSMKSY